jgi:hypothetical protein
MGKNIHWRNYLCALWHQSLKQGPGEADGWFDIYRVPVVGFQARALSSFGQRIVHATSAVNKAKLTRCAASPNTTLSNRINLFGRFIARSGNSDQKLTVAIFNRALRHPIKFWAKAIEDVRFAR